MITLTNWNEDGITWLETTIEFVKEVGCGKRLSAYSKMDDYGHVFLDSLDAAVFKQACLEKGIELEIVDHGLENRKSDDGEDIYYSSDIENLRILSL